jgi:phospholipase C
VVEVMLENHTFDNLFARWPGADTPRPGITFPNPQESFDSAPPVGLIVAGANQGSVGNALDNGRRAELMAMDRQANGKFAMDDYTQLPFDGLASITTFPAAEDPNLQYLAAHYALLDHNFQPVIGPTQPNVTAALAGSAEGWYFNNQPPANVKFHTIFDELQNAGRSWRIFYGVPPALLAGSIWDRYMPAGTDGNLVALGQFYADAADGGLPDFSFVRPGSGYSEEPPEDVSLGDAWLGQVVKAVMQGPDWKSTAIFITYDEGGAFWDHVPPPQPDADGYGTRTPMVVVSPYTSAGLDKQRTTNLSVVSFMQHLWSLPSLSKANSLAPPLTGLFDHTHSPAAPHLPPVAPANTLRVAEGTAPSLTYTASPGAAVTIDVSAGTPSLVTNTALDGEVRLSVTGSSGAAQAAVPSSVLLTAGTGSFVVRFPTAGYWRVVATGPQGAIGWATIEVGTNADTP